MPYFIFAFLVSFLTKVTMPAFEKVKLFFSDNRKFKLILFSHGLGANLNAYSSICSWFASHGYIVVSVQHSHDKICVDHRKQP
jgi:predicted dienelactone hydrolase